MTQSQRLNTKYAFAGPYEGEPVEISGSQFTALESAGKRSFNSDLRDRIQKALYFFTVSRDIEKKLALESRNSSS